LPGTAFIGTSGWNYPHWKDDFYCDVLRKDWLAHCARHFSALEINATFYRLQRESTFARWRDTTPPAFRFAMKGNRYITHNKKLADPLPSIRLEKQRARALGDKLAVVLWQLPGNYHKHLGRLEAFVRALGHWPQVRHAMEFRHPSWFVDEVLACLRDHHVAVCQSDAADWPLWDAISTDLVYIRLHGHTRTYASAYSTPSLRAWAGRIRHWLHTGSDVHVYFDNDSEGAAPRDALRLIDELRG
jgi:uncharacterized protein YecE (DUF72 family)